MTESATGAFDRPIEVAIVGGGCAGITTAFELTRPELRGRYRVTLYQQGWRLGGKAASGRGALDRIEEHGLHIWMGCYDNAFQLIRECYAELGRPAGSCRFADWRDAFVPDPYNGVADRNPAGDWLHWTALLPPAPGDPGDAPEDREPVTVFDYLTRCAGLVGTLLRSVDRRRGAAGAAAAGGSGLPHPEQIWNQLGRWLRYGRLASLATIIEAASFVEKVFGASAELRGSGRWGEPLEARIRELLGAISSGAREQLSRLARADDEVRRLWEVIDFQLAILRGILRHGLATHPQGFDAINDYELREWLAENGASEETLDSAFVRALYDLFFAYRDGDPQKPQRAAGDALRSTLRMYFTYRGAFFWKLRAGMGDVMFAPYYEVLRRRGVRFEFFHRLENVGLSLEADPEDGGYFVDRLEFDVQARTESGRPYDPLVDVDGLPCWPARADYSQLRDGERLEVEGWDFESFWDRRKVDRRVLRVGEDFDFVVLAVGLGAIPHVCSEIVERDGRWQDMLEHMGTTATQAFQIWMGAGMEELGWHDSPINLSGFVHPYTAYADMRQLIPEERWSVPPRTLAYFCGPLATSPADRAHREYPVLERERARRNAVRFLERDAGKLWPGWLDPSGRFRWELLMAPSDPAGRAPRGVDASRFESQFWTANVNPSDRYTLTLPGSSAYRISPLDTTYDNLVVAGDWTACGYNEGCVESAVMSGRLAAHAISGLPQLSRIIGYDPAREVSGPRGPETSTEFRGPAAGQSEQQGSALGPLFIDSQVAEQTAAPYEYEGMLLRTFPIPADPEALRAYCDRFLNIGDALERGFRVWPLAEMVYLQVVFYPLMQAPDWDFGAARQFEVDLVVPLVMLDPSLRPIRLVNTVAFCFVTNSWSMNTGRAILGIPKLMAHIESTDASTEPYDTSMSLLGFESTGPRSEMRLHRVLEIRQEDASASVGPGGFDFYGPTDRLFGDGGDYPFYHRFGEIGIAESDLRVLLEDACLETGVRMVQLKQLRSSEDMRLACFQGIVESTMAGQVTSSGLLPPGRVEIEGLASLEIPRTLGIASTTTAHPYFLTANGRLASVRNLWVAR